MKQLLLYTGLLLLMLQTACTKKFDEINTDPTQGTEENFDPNSLLSFAQYSFASPGYSQLLYPSTSMQVLASTFNYYGNGDKYVNTGGTIGYQGLIFTECYANSSRIYEMMRLTKDKNINLYNIGKIMYVLILQRCTDAYGDVPYTEANRAKEGITKPKYDRQEDIYHLMLQQLDTAIQALDPAQPRPTNDLFYKGDLTKWKRFGYSLMLRIAMRLTKIDAVTARTWAEKAAAGGTLSGVGDNAFVICDVSKAQDNTSNAMLTGNDFRELRWSKTFIDFLRSTNDPRLGVVGEVSLPGLANNGNQGLTGDTSAAAQLGLPNGYDLLGGDTDIRDRADYPGGTGTGTDVAPLGKYSRPRVNVFMKRNGTDFVLTYAESELLLAEAKARNWDVPGAAAQHYANGVGGAMQQMAQFDAAAAISADAIQRYVGTHTLDMSSLEASLEMINTQYWAATIFNFVETWSNWRRSGYPRLTPVNYPGNITGGVIPRRMIYLASEQLNNGDHYRAGVSTLTPAADLLTSRVWWDK
ncbi:SusD/RagB family nutrient-binding outer membrane lipoprotein [Chitinophaga agrisoli]|uniref:SusD/RagB family nutrient-binding outer membrane lipoprotein n=1 Tax=Chitinophaga agrisoli TaxID=2607653 RepID=A0A5B2VU53_9BACT|nr:SusD/RagB family nutrient-binding outer membrane lipoprotein [Chitinophaga agrisoli]KAA2241842.1 SusD/RagB family nutrient-binding outer membrane lipoprotein [Chitinophaga agrisoli]